METRTIFHTDMSNYETLTVNAFEIAYYTQMLPEANRVNQDAIGIAADNTKAVLVVADGVGGNPKGEEASQICVEKIIKGVSKNFSSTRKESRIRSTVLDCIEASNDAILQTSSGAATTATICAIDQDFLRCYQVGDSSLLLCGQKGLLKYKAPEHSPVGFALRAGLMNEKTALDHPDRHLVSNLLGDANMFIEIGPQIPFALHDTVLLATDGLFDNVESETLIEIIRKTALSNVMESLIELVKAKDDASAAPNLRKPDDVSFIVCRHQKT